MELGWRDVKWDWRIGEIDYEFDFKLSIVSWILQLNQFYLSKRSMNRLCLRDYKLYCGYQDHDLTEIIFKLNIFFINFGQKDINQWKHNYSEEIQLRIIDHSEVIQLSILLNFCWLVLTLQLWQQVSNANVCFLN